MHKKSAKYAQHYAHIFGKLYANCASLFLYIIYYVSDTQEQKDAKL